eukprot:10977712-Alexandrium_andersonii.AAC.1
MRTGVGGEPGRAGPPRQTLNHCLVELETSTRGPRELWGTANGQVGGQPSAATRSDHRHAERTLAWGWRNA